MLAPLAIKSEEVQRNKLMKGLVPELFVELRLEIGCLHERDDGRLEGGQVHYSAVLPCR